MAIREVPRSFVYTCDGCGQEHTQAGADGHYTNSTPPLWGRLRINMGPDERLTLDLKSAAETAERFKRWGSTEALLCGACFVILTDLLNRTFPRRVEG